MNRDRVEYLLAYIESQPPELVDMRQYFKSGTGPDKYAHMNNWTDRDVIPPCDTCACIGGHAIILFRLSYGRDEFRSVCYLVSEHLGIDFATGGALMLDHIKGKGKQAAIKRLQYLLANGSMDGYNYDNELCV